MTVNLFGGRAGTGRAREPHHVAWVGPDSSKWPIGLWEEFLLVINIGWFMGMCPSAQPNNIGMEDRDS